MCLSSQHCVTSPDWYRYVRWGFLPGSLSLKNLAEILYSLLIYYLLLLDNLQDRNYAMIYENIHPDTHINKCGQLCSIEDLKPIERRQYQQGCVICNYLIINLATLLLGHSPKELKSGPQKYNVILVVISAIIHGTQDVDTTYMSDKRQVD